MPVPERHLIKKYANRKLYDTRTSRYVTLDEIAQLVRGGHDITVVDRDSGHDLTQVILSQIVLTEERRGPKRLMDAGADALDRGQALLDYVRKTLMPGELVNEMERRRGNLEAIVDEAIERALRQLRLPSRHDIDRINERLDKLQAEIQRSNGRARPAARTRKAAR
ncbi:MAG TPA: polyhydroxyalkanoate synthesis regulator DNA-binding domain-containing protein [Candidatus Dormibacteraeota bacterium]|nr:polyhydroxyalkanoate synthesis regulator DNA-binding domain-containing protein [Candidatus Dormibacteraeota bacterium]